MDHHGQLGREPGGLLVPVADDRHRADQQRRPPLAGRSRLPLALDEGERLDRLAEPHVVGQASPEAPAAEEAEPGEPSQLIGPEDASKTLGRGERLEPRSPFELGEQVGEPAGRLHAREVEGAGRFRGPERHLHGLPRRDRRLPLRLPEREGGLDLLGVDLDPLAAHLHQRRLEPGQRLQLGERQGLVAQRDLPVEVEDGVERQPGLAGHLRRRDHRPGRQPELGPLAGPPGGQEHAEAGLFQRRGLLREEIVRPGGVEVVARGRGRLQARLDPRANCRRLAEGREQELTRSETVASEDLRFAPSPLPHGLGRNQEAQVVDGLEEIGDAPATGVLAGVGFGLLQPQAEPERRGRGQVDRPTPLSDLFGQPRQLLRVARHAAVRRAQGVDPLIVQAGELFRGLPRRLRRRPHQVIDERPQHLGKLGRCRRPRRIGGVEVQGAAGMGHRASQPLGLEPFRAGEHRLPSRPERRPVTLRDHAREILLPRDQRPGEAQDGRPVGQRLPDDHARPPGRPIDAGDQDRDRLLGRQDEGRHLPGGNPDRAPILRSIGQQRARRQRPLLVRGEPCDPSLPLFLGGREAGNLAGHSLGEAISLQGEPGAWRPCRLDPPGRLPGCLPGRPGRCLAPQHQPPARRRRMQNDHDQGCFPYLAMQGPAIPRRCDCQ